jgi:hypothetical protein
MQTKLLGILVILLLFAACKEVEDPFQLPDDDSAEFYPLYIGKYWLYELDSIIYAPNAAKPIDTLYREVREEVVDTFLDLLGNTWYRIDRFERASDTLPWSINQVVAAAVHGKEALRLENDLTFVKLLFPLEPFKTWNGNKDFDPAIIIRIAEESLEMFKGWEYRVLNEGGQDTVRIQQANTENFIELRYARETYVRGKGLAERELRILDTQNIDDTRPWEEKAEKGFILRQRLVETN